MHLYAYNENSEGARELATALGIRRIRREGSTYVGGPNKVVINWGASQLPENVARSRIINVPARLAAMSNKLTFFQLMSGAVRTPEWTADRAVAGRWLTEGAKVVGRSILNGHSGAGISIHERAFAIDTAGIRLYTKYVPKMFEYRVHFAFGQIIDIQRKIKDPARDVVNWSVRSHANGFIYVRNEVRETMPGDVLGQAEALVGECGLDFGAIDIIYNDRRGEAYVLEINTAPGISGETVTSYANAFRHLR